MRLIGLTLRRRRRFVALGVVGLAAVATGFATIAARGGSIGCIPVISAREYATSPAFRGQRAIGEVLGSGVGRQQVYVRTQGFRLFVGSGDPTHWRQERAFAPGRLLGLLPRHGRDAIYAGYRALYRSGNGGQSWERLGCGHVLDGVAVAARQPNLIYVAADVLDGPPQGVGGGLYRTRDGGRTWSHVSVLPPMGLRS